MEFSLNDDHKAIIELCRDFGEKHVAPNIRENDRQQKFDRSILKKMADLDMLGLCLPEKHGGAGMDYISLGLASEELAVRRLRTDSPFGAYRTQFPDTFNAW